MPTTYNESFSSSFTFSEEMLTEEAFMNIFTFSSTFTGNPSPEAISQRFLFVSTFDSPNADLADNRYRR